MGQDGTEGIVILNFYLRKRPPKGEMRTVERQNLANVRQLLIARGVKHVSKLDYQEAIQLLAKLIAEECAEHCMGKVGTGHRLIQSGIAGDTSSDSQNRHSNHHTHKRDPKLERGYARAN